MPVQSTHRYLEWNRFLTGKGYLINEIHIVYNILTKMD